MKKKIEVAVFIVFITLALIATAMSKSAAATEVQPHLAPTFNCHTFKFDPEPGTVIHVAMQFDSEPSVPNVDGNFVTATDRSVTVPHSANGTKGMWRAGLPDIFPGAWTAWTPYDCTAPVVPPVVVPEPPVAQPQPELVPPVVVVQPPASVDTHANELAYTGSGTLTLVLIGVAMIGGGLFLQRKGKVA